MPLPPTITSTAIWHRSLADDGDEHERAGKGQLRSAFIDAREKARKLAEEIPRYLPDFTDHSVDHMDSLWRVADQILPADYPLNPAEAFVFACAVLVHDCAMSVAAYPGGMRQIRRTLLWRDLVAQIYRDMYGRRSRPEELDEPGPEIEGRALGEFLRRNHAEQAEKLPSQAWAARNGVYYLISDERLREHFGYTIGVAAHSHHWSVDRLVRDLPLGPGPLPGLPGGWDIDTLKVACILRVADACHLDERRAPSFSRALRDLPVESAKHWDFQNRLTLRPRKPEEESLVFVSTRPFTLEMGPSWWLAYDTLAMANRELSTVDAALREHGRESFGARRIQGATSPVELANFVKTDGWEPLDARLHVGDVPALIDRMGGRALYGDRPGIAIRELVQNAADAVRTRRILEDRADDWGDVTVAFERVLEGADRGWWLHIRDTGVGMTDRCLTDYLLNFGESYWRSSLAASEHPGLHTRGVEHTGIYGIGFFSAFMLGDRVKVFTRFYRGDGKTRVLEFGAGLHGRPLIRNASPAEMLFDPGTAVAILIHGTDTRETELPDVSARAFAGLLTGRKPKRHKTEVAPPHVALAQAFPAADVNIALALEGSTISVVRANDWLTISPLELFRRAPGFENAPNGMDLREGMFKISCSTMTKLHFKSGEICGRLSINADQTFVNHQAEWFGIETPLIVTTKVGGISIADVHEASVNIQNSMYLGGNHPQLYGGLIQGDVLTASLDRWKIREEDIEFAPWVEAQQRELKSIVAEANLVVMFHNARQLGVLCNELPMVFCCDGGLTESQFREYVRPHRELRVALEVKRNPGHFLPSKKGIAFGASDVADIASDIADVQMFIYTRNFYGGVEIDEKFVDVVEEAYNYGSGSRLRMAEYIGWIICDVWQTPPRTIFETTPPLRSDKDPRSIRRRIRGGSFVEFLVINIRR
jgi:hypothetical protein